MKCTMLIYYSMLYWDLRRFVMGSNPAISSNPKPRQNAGFSLFPNVHKPFAALHIYSRLRKNTADTAFLHIKCNMKCTMSN